MTEAQSTSVEDKKKWREASQKRWQLLALPITVALLGLAGFAAYQKLSALDMDIYDMLKIFDLNEETLVNPDAAATPAEVPKGTPASPKALTTPATMADPQESIQGPNGSGEVTDGVKEVRAKGGYWSQFAPSTPGDTTHNLAQLKLHAEPTGCYGTYEGVRYEVWASKSDPDLYHYIPVRG